MTKSEAQESMSPLLSEAVNIMLIKRIELPCNPDYLLAPGKTRISAL